VTDSHLVEVDQNGRQVFAHSFQGAERIMKGVKTADGEIVCLTSEARVVRLDKMGRELSSFTVNLRTRLFGGRIDVLRNGRVLIPQNGENKVVEYDPAGKVIWEVAVEQPVAAVRLPNGNTLVTTMTENRAVEFDRRGTEVWQFRSNTRVTRALRR